MAEPVPHEGISTRKLVLETAYYNVMTAYSTDELFRTVQRFPQIDGLIIHSELQRFESERDIPKLREILDSTPIIMLASSEHMRFKGADYTVPSYDPQHLLSLIKDALGTPEENVE